MHGLESRATPNYDLTNEDPSRPQKGDQEPHVDDDPVATGKFMAAGGPDGGRRSDDDFPLVILIGIMPKTRLRIRRLRSQTYEIVHLDIGDMLVFRGDSVYVVVGGCLPQRARLHRKPLSRPRARAPPGLQGAG